MNRRLRRIMLVGLLALALGGVAGPAVADVKSKRVVTYFCNFDLTTLPATCELLKEACRQGTLTHILVGLFHLGWVDSAKTIPTIHLNEISPEDPRLDPLWAATRYIQTNFPNVKVMATFGGGGVGDYRQLLDPAEFWFWYGPLKNMLTAYHFAGIDLDIEEGREPNDYRVYMVNTANVEYLVRQLREDFGPAFLVSSAPVAAALIDPADSMSPYVDYIQLLHQGLFDWYNVQFYNGWGDLLNLNWPPDYPTVVSTHNLPPQKLVAGVPTNPTAGSNPYYDITSPLYMKFRGLSFQYKDFGGVMGWHFDVAQVAGVLDPVGWTHYAYWAQHGKDLSAIVSLLLND